MKNNKILYRSNFILFSDDNRFTISIYELDHIDYHTIALYSWFSHNNKLYCGSINKPSAPILQYLKSIGINKPSVIKS